MNVQANIVGPEWSCRGESLRATRHFNSSSRLPSRVVTVASLSSRIANHFISETLARALNTETGASVLLIDLEMAQGRTSLQEWLRIQPQVNGEFAFAGFLEREGQVGKLTVCLTNDAAEAASIVSLVQHCLRHFRYVLWHVGADVPVPILMECLIQSEKTFLLLQPASEN